MNNWTWQTWQGKSYLTCDLISQPHGFFTSAFAPQRPEALTSALNPEAEVLRTKQVHGNVVLAPIDIRTGTKTLVTSGASTTTEEEVQRPHADGCFSDKAGQAMWVCTADCTPALIADKRTGQVAAAHAGWRGTAQKIVPVAIAQLQAQGSQLEDIQVLLGPAIAGEVYQVGEDVATEIGMSIVDTEQFTDPAAVIDHLLNLDNPPLLPDKKPGHVRLDVRRINEIQLEQLGVSAEQVAAAPHCTYQEPERFFSYRRTKLKQVQWSGIIST
ncbi:peptidoglycan editing factor PgeF [Leptothoe spongobia]|uniref:Purine nucleoside phosphorylase n=1 Tax=Leptothoe spongobia TAU-MAC 1115 TaxID=1967444 RepID=A0A947DDN4_9CYAN|nr:peptidoglycan editing factor PgeF [Leptothoe spongobia]MBT9315142.1 peptidoglycan editing factor PgeF [Leptothoe spongobia TAU-MAC 1115]